jgi:hypothetical protein
MPGDVSTDRRSEAVELGSLLANTIGAVVEAQERIDAYTMLRKQEYEAAPEGSLALPPLWYAFNKVAVEIELSATVRTSKESIEARPVAAPAPRAQLFCHTLNPAMVSLYGYQASSGLRIQVQLALRGALPLKDAEEVRR